MQTIQDFRYKGNTLKVVFVSPSEFYDHYAPAVYGNILRIVKKEEIAEKVLEIVFRNVFKGNALKRNELSSTFTAILNQSGQKAQSTLKAIQIAEALAAPKAFAHRSL